MPEYIASNSVDTEPTRKPSKKTYSAPVTAQDEGTNAATSPNIKVPITETVSIMLASCGFLYSKINDKTAAAMAIPIKNRDLSAIPKYDAVFVSSTSSSPLQ